MSDIIGGWKQWLWAHSKMLIGIFLSTLALKSGGIIGKIFGTLGLTWVTYHYVMPEIRGYMQGYFNGLPADVYDLITYCRFDVFITLILSASATKLMSGLMLGRVGGEGS